MNFSINNDFNTRVNYATRAYSAKVSGAKDSEKASANYDTVSISRNEVKPESEFAQILSQEISKSVQAGTSQSRVQELHDMVQTGQYQVNAQRVAEKLLGYRG